MQDKFNGMRPKGCKKPQKDLELSDFAKVIRGKIGDRNTYARIPIRRKTPEEIMYNTPLEDADDLERRIRLIVEWYRSRENTECNIMIEFAAHELTDEEMDALIADGDEGVLFEVPVRAEKTLPNEN